MSRKINIIGDIDWDSFSDFNEALSELEDIKKPVQVTLASDGGDVHAALAFIARIRLSPCDVHISVYGNVASAATLILASGDWRMMTKEAWAMVHEDSATLDGEKTYLKREIRHIEVLDKQWNQLMFEFTGTEVGTWIDLNERTTYLTADACKQYGLVDEII